MCLYVCVHGTGGGGLVVCVCVCTHKDTGVGWFACVCKYTHVRTLGTGSRSVVLSLK